MAYIPLYWHQSWLIMNFHIKSLLSFIWFSFSVPPSQKIRRENQVIPISSQSGTISCIPGMTTFASAPSGCCTWNRFSKKKKKKEYLDRRYVDVTTKIGVSIILNSEKILLALLNLLYAIMFYTQNGMSFIILIIL